jgi:hypothetical protein
MKGGYHNNANEIWRNIRECIEKLYSNTLENLGEMENFLDAFDLPKFTQDNRSIMNKKVETLAKHVPTKSPRLDAFTSDFYQIFNEVIKMLLKILCEIKMERMLLNLCYEVILIPNKATTKTENCRSISSMIIHAKYLNKYL